MKMLARLVQPSLTRVVDLASGANNRILKLRSTGYLSPGNRNLNKIISEKDFWKVFAMKLELVNEPRVTLSELLKNKEKR